MQNNNDKNNDFTEVADQIEDNLAANQTERTIPRKISLKEVIFAIIIGILLGSLFVFIFITRNLMLAQIIIPVYIIIILIIVLLGLSSKEITKFQPSLKELYRKLFKDPPSSYFNFGLTILIGLNLGIFAIYVLFVCVKWDNPSCDISLYIFGALYISGIILAAFGLVLSVKKAQELQKKEIVQSEAQQFMEYLRKNAFPELVEENEVRSYIQELNSAWEDAAKLEKLHPQSLSNQEIAWQDKKKALMTFLDQLHVFIRKKQFHATLLQKETMVGQLTGFLQVYTPTIYKEFISKKQRIADLEP